jgi:hypothetical protein
MFTLTQVQPRLTVLTVSGVLISKRLLSVTTWEATFFLYTKLSCLRFNSSHILINMKIRFLRKITVDIEKPKINEVWDKTFNRWTEIQVLDIFDNGSTATLKTYDGDFILAVPTNAFEKVAKEDLTSLLK